MEQFQPDATFQPVFKALRNGGKAWDQLVINATLNDFPPSNTRIC